MFRDGVVPPIVLGRPAVLRLGLGAPETSARPFKKRLDFLIDLVKPDERLLVAATTGVGQRVVDKLARVHVVEVVIEGEVVAGADGGGGVLPVVEQTGD